MTTSRSRGRSMSTSRRLCSRGPRTEIRSGSPAGTTLGAGRAFGAADTALATRLAADFFPFAAGWTRVVAGFAAALAGIFSDGAAAAFAAPVDAAFVALFALGR